MAGPRTKKKKSKKRFKHGIEHARRVFGHRDSGSATDSTTTAAAPGVGGHLDPHKLVELAGNAQFAGSYAPLFNEWYTDLGIFMDARNAASTTAQGKRDLEVTMLHHLYKAAVGERGRAERLGKQITPFLDQASRYHRSTPNQLIDRVTVAFEESLNIQSRNAPAANPSSRGAPTANPNFQRIGATGPAANNAPPRMPTSQLHLIHNATFSEVVARELNTQDLLPDPRIGDKAAFESAVDHLLSQVDSRQATEAVEKGESTGDRVFFDVTTMFTQQLGQQEVKDGAATTINSIASELQSSFKDRLTHFLDGKPTDGTFDQAGFDAKLSKVVTGMQLGAFTEHEGQAILLTPHFFTDPELTAEQGGRMGDVFATSNLQKQSQFNDTLTTTLKESGFRPDPVESKEAWLKVKSFEEILSEQKIPTVKQGYFTPVLAQPAIDPAATLPANTPPASATPANTPPGDPDAITPVDTTPVATTTTAAPSTQGNEATFKTVDDFRDTSGYKAFATLGQTPPPPGEPRRAPARNWAPWKPTISRPDSDLWKGDPPPYVTVLTTATTDLLDGLDSNAVATAFHDKGLDDLLPKIFYRMANAMGEASFQQQNLPGFLNQIDIIHSHLSAILNVTNPHAETAFNDGLLGFLNKDTIPAALQPLAHANVYPSAIHTVATTLASVAAQKGGDQNLNVAVLKDSYYESATAISRSKTYTVFEVAKNPDPTGPGVTITHQQGGPLQSAPGSSTPDGKNLDVYLAEFQHNISGTRGSYGMEDVKGQVDQIFSEGRAGKPLTVVIDNTIDRLKSDALTEFLEHNEGRINDGSLNVVIFKSAQKFDMLGSDNYYGGYAVTVNNGGPDHVDFNTRMNDPRDQLQGLNRQGLTHLVTHAPEGLDAYRASIMANTHGIYDKLSPGLTGNTSTPTPSAEPATLKISTIEPGSKQVFLDLNVSGALASGARDAFLAAFSRFRDARGLAVDNRPSFGFAIANLMYIDGIGIRFNPGLEGAQGIADYAKFFNDAHAIFTKPRPGITDPKDISRQIIADLARINPDVPPRRFPWMPSLSR